MKTTSFRVLISAFVVTVALTALSLVASTRATAQGETHPFKVGDRVEVDTMYSQDPAKSVSWRKGTIVKLPLTRRIVV